MKVNIPIVTVRLRKAPNKHGSFRNQDKNHNRLHEFSCTPKQIQCRVNASSSSRTVAVVVKRVKQNQTRITQTFCSYV